MLTRCPLCSPTSFLKEIKGLLTRLYTQNIDGLDFQTGTSSDKIISCHGTMGKVQCEFCYEYYPVEEYGREVIRISFLLFVIFKVKKKIKDIYNMDNSAPSSSTNIPCLSCGKNGVKPATVLFGRSLPPEFFEGVEEVIFFSLGFTQH